MKRGVGQFVCDTLGRTLMDAFFGSLSFAHSGLITLQNYIFLYNHHSSILPKFCGDSVTLFRSRPLSVSSSKSPEMSRLLKKSSCLLSPLALYDQEPSKVSRTLPWTSFPTSTHPYSISNNSNNNLKGNRTELKTEFPCVRLGGVSITCIGMEESIPVYKTSSCGYNYYYH